jgi:hypothetical protein
MITLPGGHLGEPVTADPHHGRDERRILNRYEFGHQCP